MSRRESLLTDRVEAGEGAIIIQKALIASGRDGEARQGIERLIGDGMDAFEM